MAQSPPEDARVARLGLCVLCGLPGAGKTTVAQALGQSLRSRFGWKCLLLSYDNLIPLEAFSQWGSSAGQMSQWKLHRHELLFYLEHFLQTFIKGNHYCPPPNRIETIWKSFVGCLKAQELILAPAGTDDCASCQYLIDFSILRPIYFILDDNFYYRSMRYEVYQLARQYNLGFCQLFLDCKIEVCLERNGQRKEPLPEEIIYAMLQKIEAPNPEKYMWEQNSLILNSAEFTLKDNLQVLDLLSTALENPVKPLEEENTELKEMDRTICATSILHQADQTIRQAVSQAMKNAKDSNLSPSAMKILAEELSKLKMEFLEDLRHRANGKKQFLQNNTFEKCITTAFNQKSDDIVKKFLNS